MAAERIEETILRNLLYNEEYYRKVVPFLKAEYFNEYHERILFEEVADFASKYDKVPTQEVLSINLQNRNDLTEDAFQSSLSTLKSLGDEWVDFNWLLDATEKWCQDRAIYLALMLSIKVADGGDKKLSNLTEGELGDHHSQTHIHHELTEVKYDQYSNRLESKLAETPKSNF